MTFSSGLVPWMTRTSGVDPSISMTWTAGLVPCTTLAVCLDPFLTLPEVCVPFLTLQLAAESGSVGELEAVLLNAVSSVVIENPFS